MLCTIQLTYTAKNDLKHCEYLGIMLRTNLGVRLLNMIEKQREVFDYDLVGRGKRD